MKIKVGSIGNYDVIYIPEKDVVFCKNTALKLSILDKIIKSGLCMTEIPEKNLTVTIDGNVIHLGCLTLTKDMYNKMKANIKRLKV